MFQILEQEEAKEEETEPKKDEEEKKGTEEGGDDKKEEEKQELKMEISEEQLELQKKAKEYLEAKGESQVRLRFS